jgi:hypothetical protein
MTYGLRGRLLLSGAALLVTTPRSTARIRHRIRPLSIALGIAVGLGAVSAAYSQNDLTRIYGPEDRAVPTPAFVSTIGQQDASALLEITNYRTVVGAVAWSGLQATGTLTDVSGNSDQATLTILGSVNFRLDVTTPTGQRSTRICGSSGATLEDDGKTFFMPPITARGGLVAFPLLLMSTFSDPTATIVDGGQVQLNGMSLHRITLEEEVFPTQSATPQRNDLSVTDLYFDPTSHLLIKSASFVRIDSLNRARFMIVVTYGDYQAVNGALVPLNLTETMNGQIQWALQLNTPSAPPASVNSSYFHF